MDGWQIRFGGGEKSLAATIRGGVAVMKLPERIDVRGASVQVREAGGEWAEVFGAGGGVKEDGSRRAVSRYNGAMDDERDVRNLDPAKPRWPALVAVLAVGGVYMALPPSLAFGPPWAELAVVGVLLVPTILTHRRGIHHWNRRLGLALAGVITAFMVASLVRLVSAVPSHEEPPVMMLRSAAALWVTNVLVFAYWYWRLDAGGPHGRDLRVGHSTEVGAFLFPQMLIDASELPGGRRGHRSFSITCSWHSTRARRSRRRTRRCCRGGRRR